MEEVLLGLYPAALPRLQRAHRQMKPIVRETRLKPYLSDTSGMNIGLLWQCLHFVV